MNKKGLIIVLSAPSGTGKTTLVHKLLRADKNLMFSVSCTTRPMRDGEKNCIDYNFLSVDDFKSNITKNKFAEWALVHDNYYGTLKSEIENAMNSGRDILLDIDVQGGINIKKAFPGAVLIFIMPPSIEELKNRLIKRNKDSKETISARLANAKNEISHYAQYDYLVVNDKLKTALSELLYIIGSERLKIVKVKNVLKGG
ncbi:MAG: guanylate kinase [Endomicrobiales bacterium]|nr:guanylate kinase [Endomicrobiales bacterium]